MGQTKGMSERATGRGERAGIRSDRAASASPDRDQVEALLEARRSGSTLREAAAAAGVHVATVCRWQARDPDLHRELHEADREARLLKYAPFLPRPHVRWRRDCPLCQAKVVVRSARRNVRFWRCGRWPWCEWASWRPRAPQDCSRCGGACFWSHSRKSIACGSCSVRILAP